MKNKRITILLIITNIILVGIICSLISKNGNIIKEKQIIKEMNESTQVTELNNQINALNTEHTDYSNYIQTCKTKIAEAITNEGITTSNDETLEAMSENISKIFKTRTNDATATADNITAGKTAYVNGELITGNGADIQSKKITKKLVASWTATISDRPSSRTINCTAVPDWNTLTTDNFVYVFTGGWSNWDGDDTNSRQTASANVTLSYNASTGVLTVSNLFFDNIINGAYNYSNTALSGQIWCYY